MVLQEEEKYLEGVGVIIPPPDVRSILETTAEFVAKRTAFEKMVLQKNGEEARFSFLHASNPYHAYYRKRIDHYRSLKKPHSEAKRKESLDEQKSKSPEPSSENLKPHKEAVEGDSPKATTAGTAVVSFLKAERAKQRALRPEPREPPPDDLFTLVSVNPAPNALSLDVMKLTAQYVASTDSQFISALARKESRNSLFDFLKPMHPHNLVFQRLTDAYRAILSSNEQKKEMLELLRKQSESRDVIMEEVWYMHNWECQKAEREYEAALDKGEKMKVAQIDWYDFVVLETIEFGPKDVNLPAPVADTRQLPKILAAAREAEKERLKNQRDVDMDIDNVAVTPKNVRVETANVLSDIPADRIRRNEPTNRRENQDRTNEATVVLPSGTRVPLSKVQESMRVELINPSYKNEKARAAEKNRLRNLADGDEVARNLARLGQAQGKGAVYNRGDLQEALAVMPKAPLSEADARVKKAEPSGPNLPAAAMNDEARPSKRARVEAAVDALSRAKKAMVDDETEAKDTEQDQVAGSSLISAEEWLAKQGNNAQVRVKLPVHNSKDWRLQGQEIEMSAPLKKTVAKLKSVLAKMTNLPANKQKLSMTGVGFLKDGMTLASYNVRDGAVISVEVKERGGRKKH
ncbi:Splicing factor 3A subunit 1 SF3-A [Gracilaria domingensis]|nr:Splicing factor 3A subunit 1 SF3-A [Gracilaria domingensis]